MILNPSRLLAALFWMLAAMPAWASHGSEVDVKLPSGKIASADFHAGDIGRPAVLVLHGFLQTRSFPTVVSILESLSTAGYTTLAPTLSLGISKRNKSLPCEAVHMHTLQDDVSEVAFWVDWLKQKGYPRIILVGHSFGNLQLLTYLGHHPSPAVKKALMISLTDVEVKQSAEQRIQLAQALRDRVAHGDKSLAIAEFGHCKQYASPPAALLSYLSISRNSILDALSHAKVPIQVVMGSHDDRMGHDWVEKLITRGIPVRVIPGASHFFDNQYEFDLQEAVLQSLTDK